MNRLLAPAVLLALSLGAAPPGQAEELMGRRLNPVPGLSPEGRFGGAVAVGGDVIAVGAYLADQRAGAVYLFRKVDGVWRSSKISGKEGEQLGFDLAIEGERLLVGAPFAWVGGVRCGTVYLYDLNSTPPARQSIEPPGACQAGAEIGSAVALKGDIVAFGARGAAGRTGRVYASFDHGGNFELLTAPGGGFGDELGQSLSIDGLTLVAGAPFSDFRGPGAGAVYVFENGSRTGTRLAPEDLRPGDAFGYAVSVEGGHLAIGAPQSDSGGQDSGAVYLRQGEGPWIQLAGKCRGDQLGVSLALTGGDGRGFAGARRGFAGACRALAGKQGEGAVYPFSPDGLGEAILSPCPKPGAEFGFAIAARGRSLLAVGAFMEDSTGAAYVFDPGPTFKLELLAPVAVPESAGKVTVTVKQTGEPMCGPLGLTVSTVSVAATAGSDFVPVIGQSVAFSESLSATIPITIVNDAVCEGSESFRVRLSDASGAVPDQQVSVAIRDDDDADLVLTPSPLSLSESQGQAGLSVSLAGPTQAPVTVTFQPGLGTVSPPRLRFTAANWNQPRTVLVTERSLLGDTRCGSNPSYPIVATAACPSGARVSRSVFATRIDDDRRCVSGAQRVCVREDGTILYTVELSNGGDLPQEDLPTDEFFLALPGAVTAVWASANHGLATVDQAGDTVAWNGVIPPGDKTVTIEILASLDSELLATPVAAQGTLTFDREGDGVLDTVRTDDPLQGGLADPTVFTGIIPPCNAVSPPFSRGGG